jgi:hypothetical protein
MFGLAAVLLLTVLVPPVGSYSSPATSARVGHRLPYTSSAQGHADFGLTREAAHSAAALAQLDGGAIRRHVTEAMTLLPAIEPPADEAAKPSNAGLLWYNKYASGDAFVANCDAGNANFGRAPRLEVRAYVDRACVSRRAFFRFNVSDFSALSVQRAILHVKAARFDRGLTLHVVGPTNEGGGGPAGSSSEPWHEDGLTWRTQPADALAPICRWTRPAGMDARRGSHNGLGHLSCDVTNDVRRHAGHQLGLHGNAAALDPPDGVGGGGPAVPRRGEISFGVYALAHRTRRAELHAREAPLEMLRPRLLIGAREATCAPTSAPTNAAIWPDRQPCLPVAPAAPAGSAASQTDVLSAADMTAAWGADWPGANAAAPASPFYDAANPATAGERAKQEASWRLREQAWRAQADADAANATASRMWTEARDEALARAKLAVLAEFYASPLGVRDDETVPRGVVQVCVNGKGGQGCELRVPGPHEQPSFGTPHTGSILNLTGSARSQLNTTEAYMTLVRNRLDWRHPGAHQHPQGHGVGRAVGPGHGGPLTEARGTLNMEALESNGGAASATVLAAATRLHNTHPWRFSPDAACNLAAGASANARHLCKQQWVTTGGLGSSVPWDWRHGEAECAPVAGSPHWACAHKRWASPCGSGRPGDCDSLARNESARYQAEQAARDLYFALEAAAAATALRAHRARANLKTKLREAAEQSAAREEAAAQAALETKLENAERVRRVTSWTDAPLAADAAKPPPYLQRDPKDDDKCLARSSTGVCVTGSKDWFRRDGVQLAEGARGTGSMRVGY